MISNAATHFAFPPSICRKCVSADLIFAPGLFMLASYTCIFVLFIYFTSLKRVAQSAFAGFHRGPLDTDTYYRHN